MRLFDPAWRFRGFEGEAFEVFSIPDRDRRRHAILDRFHPGLHSLSDDLFERLPEIPEAKLHSHLPRLDWPKGYQPFCTWLALSRLAHGYQADAQLNVGVHRDYVAARLAWDTAADAFGRFEFRCLHGGLGALLAGTAAEAGLVFRVYAAAPWPEGSRLVFESADDWKGSFAEVARRGVWWELGRRWAIPAELPLITTPDLGKEILRVFEALVPCFRKVEG